MTAPSPIEQDRRRPRVRRKRVLMLIAAAAALLTLAALAPVAMVAIGTRRATACLAAYERPRSAAAAPDCATSEMSWFLTPAYVPWTSWDARYRAEELLARSAIATYVDAAVGRADGAALARAAGSLDNVARTVRAGSRRIAMDDLGVAMGSPDSGSAAHDLGDRARLLERPQAWLDWPVRKAALDAALLEADLPRAERIAATYAGFDPRDEDLRTHVGALLCLGSDPRRGLELLTSIQDDRAARRYAAMSRNWGEVRAVIVACAARAKVEPPAKPASGEAGRDDAPEARAALRIKLGGLGMAAEHALPREAPSPRRGGAAEPLGEALQAAGELLRKGTAGSPDQRALLAVTLAAGGAATPRAAAEMCRPPAEGPDAFGSREAALTAADLLDETARLRPIAPPQAFEAAAARLGALADRAADEPTAETLRRCASELLTERARALARALDPGEAAASIDAGATGAGLDATARALARSSAWYVAGDAAHALTELDAVAPAAAPPEGPATRLVRAAALLQRAEILASLGRKEEAGDAAIAADDAAHAAGDRTLEVRAAFTRIALATPAQRLREAAVAAAPAKPAFVWLGFADPRRPWREPQARDAVRHDLAAWSEALAAAPEQKSALRYALLRVRGDAAPWPLPWLALGSAMAPEGGDAEIWLDAFFALDEATALAAGVRLGARRGGSLARGRDGNGALVGAIPPPGAAGRRSGAGRDRTIPGDLTPPPRPRARGHRAAPRRDVPAMTALLPLAVLMMVAILGCEPTSRLPTALRSPPADPGASLAPEQSAPLALPPATRPSGRPR